MITRINWRELTIDSICLLSLSNTLFLAWHGYYIEHHWLALWCVLFNVLNVMAITCPRTVIRVDYFLRLNIFMMKLHIRRIYHLIFKSQ